MTNDPYPNERYRCRSDDEVVTGSQGLREHARQHAQRGDGPAEWDILDEECTCGEAWEGHPSPHALTCPQAG